MRIDKFIVDKLNISRTKAQQLIKNGLVFYGNNKIEKVSFEVTNEELVLIKENKQYVSRGAYKLIGAIDEFNLDFKNKVVLDIGASTGGFTQVVLENGAKKVYAVDIGENELAQILKEDNRVVNIHSTDFRSLTKHMVEDVDFIIGDISFISLKLIFPKIKELYGNNIEICILFKPQFECGIEYARKYKGVVLDKKLHERLLIDFLGYLENLGFKVCNLAYSNIKGKQGNIEYLIYINANESFNVNVKEVVNSAFNTLTIK